MNIRANRSAVTSRRSSITSNVRNRQNITASTINLSPEKRAFAAQLRKNYGSTPVMAATNTSNIMARPDFLELLPMFVQKLLILDVFGSVAMRSRQQLIPYFKFVAENTKGQTHAGDILSSPFANRQGIDPNFTGRVVKNELVAEGATISFNEATTDIIENLAYLPVLPGSVTVTTKATNGVVSKIIDNGVGALMLNGAEVGYINYSNGQICITTEKMSGNAPTADAGSSITATYQYDNETVGPHVESNLAHGQYGAFMGKGELQLDEINLVAEARQLACYWSIYSAFAAQQEYGSNIGDIAKEAAFSELTAEINSWGFDELRKAASYKPQFNWDASPVLNGSVVPTDYLNMFKLKLNQAAAATYQETRLSQPNRLIVGTNVASYIGMINGFQAAPTEDNVGPYKAGTLDQFEVYVDPNYDPNLYVMSCKSTDIRRNSALFGEYMPLTNTDAIGLANSSVQQGYATMCAMKVVNPASVVSGRIVGTF